MVAGDGYQVGGHKNLTWYSGTKNVDIGQSSSRDVLAVVPSGGSYAYRQNTNTYVRRYVGVWNGGFNGVDYYFEPLYQNFVRIYTIRRECDVILQDPSRFIIYANTTRLDLINGDTEFSPGITRTWQGPWVNPGFDTSSAANSSINPDGTPLVTGGHASNSEWAGTTFDTYTITLGSVAVNQGIVKKGWGSTNFNIAVRSISQDALLGNVALQIYDSKTREWIVRALFTFTPTRIEIGIVTGILSMQTFDFLTYKGKSVASLESGDFYSRRISSKEFADYMHSIV